jgi:hypothetical protein
VLPKLLRRHNMHATLCKQQYVTRVTHPHARQVLAEEALDDGDAAQP